MEKLARYVLRNPFSVAKMRLTGPDGTVFYQSRMNPKARANFVAFKPADFLVAAHPQGLRGRPAALPRLRWRDARGLAGGLSHAHRGRETVDGGLRPQGRQKQFHIG